MNTFIKIITSKAFITSAIAVVLCFILLRVINHVYRTLHKDEINRPGMRERIVPGYMKVIRWIIIALTVLIVLQANGIDLSSMFKGLGVFSIIAGLALQDLFKDIIMGIHITSHHFFQVGDIVKIDGFEGRVVDFNLQTTKLESVEDLSIRTICNREITKADVSSNIQYFILPLSYDLKLEEVDAIAEEITEKAKTIADLRQIDFLGTDNFDSSAINYRFRLICDPDRRFTVIRQLRRVIQEVLEAHHTSIPYDQLDVHTD